MGKSGEERKGDKCEVLFRGRIEELKIWGLGEEKYDSDGVERRMFGNIVG